MEVMGSWPVSAQMIFAMDTKMKAVKMVIMKSYKKCVEVTKAKWSWHLAGDMLGHGFKLRHF